MALFTINRYMGEDDTPESATPSSPDVLLSNLYEKVQRKKLLQERRNDGLLSTDEKVSTPGIDTVSKRKKKKKKNKEEDGDKEKDEDGGTDGVISSKHKTETRKEVSDGTENEVIDGESHDVQKGLKRTSNIHDDDNNSDSLPVIETTRDKVTMPRAEKKKKRDKRKRTAEEEQKDEGKVSVKNAKKSKKKRKVLSESLETEINGESVQCQENVTRPATVDDDEVDDDNENDDDDRTLTKKRKTRESSPSTATSVNQNLQDKSVKKSKRAAKKVKGKSVEADSVKGELDQDNLTDDNTTTKNKSKKKKKKKTSAGNSGDCEKDELESHTDEKDDSEDDPSDQISDENKEEKMETEDEVTKEDGELGFTILGDIENQKAEKVHRVLPNWLANPSIIENVSDLKTCKLEDLSGLDEKLVAKLQECGFTHFFPVQQQVIPAILKCVRHGLQAGIGGFRPSDMCVSAPTGSGKTLAFVIPIVQALMKRIVCQVRALVVLPTRDLAMQVHQVFTRISKGTGLKVVLTAGHKTLSQEQSSLVKEGNCGFMSLADVIVATPGRLVDHISKTEGFTLQYLRFLVIDEADRMIDQISRDWIRQVEKAAYTSVDGSVVRKYHTKMTVANAFKIQLPLQKLLFSATLSQNPEKLMQLNLFQPRLFTSVVKATNDPDSILKKEGEFVGKYTTPAGLTEHLIQCDAGEKPLMVLYLLEKFKLSQVLCFTNTVEATHRLHLLLKLCRGSSVGEFSANLTPAQRTRLLKQFKDGEVQILVCSDAMARGMDIVEANAVICYDVPPFIKTYIHRVGRTARAGREGTAYTLVLDKQRKRFESMLKDAGKGNVQWMKVKRKALQPHIEDYEGALQKLPEVLQNEEKGKKS